MRETELVIRANDRIADGIYRLELGGDVGPIGAGQFLNLSLGRADMPLRRPFGIARHTADSVTVCYQVVGKGTEYLATLSAGAKLRAVLPLGNGFDVGEAQSIALVGGGVGIFPLLSVAEGYDREFRSYLGYRNADKVCLTEDFKRRGAVRIATDDGSYGEQGSVLTMLKEDLAAGVRYDLVLACGPTAMLKAMQKMWEELPDAPKCYISTEERMGCGIGACLVCTCKVTRKGTTERLRACKDGPVFEIGEVEL